MPVIAGKICEAMEKLAPKALAEEWDNVGLLVGRKDAEIGKILVALDVTDDVVEEAVAIGANMIISHHPLVFKPISCINDETHLGKKLLKIIEHKLNIYAAHTNLDITAGGTNDIFAKKLELDKTENIIFDDKGENYIGRAGYLKQPMKLSELAGLLKEALSLETIRFVGDSEAVVSKVGICTGSGSKNNYFSQVKAAGCHVYITGDICYHQAQDALNTGLNLIDATHYASEAMAVNEICNYLNNELSNENVAIVSSNVDGQVFKNI